MFQTKQQWTDNRKQAVWLQEKAHETVSIIWKEGAGNDSNYGRCANQQIAR